MWRRFGYFQISEVGQPTGHILSHWPIFVKWDVLVWLNIHDLQEASQISIHEAKNSDGAYYLELKVPSRVNTREGCWNFLEKFGFRYGYESTRPLLASEVFYQLTKLDTGIYFGCNEY